MKILDRLLKAILYPTPYIPVGKMRRQMAGKVCLVTGASFGIGLALTHQLLDLGAKVITLARHTEEWAGTYPYRVDFKNRDEVVEVAKRIAEEHPRIDYLFVNAGKSICRSIPDTIERLHDYERTMSINYSAHVALLLALRPNLRAGRARIIYSGSVSLLFPYAPKWSAYHASKGAMEIWLRTAKVEWHCEGISIKIAYLPLVHTPMSGANPNYRQLTGYSAEEAANILLRLSRRKLLTTYIPWWARLTAPLARLLRVPIEQVYMRQ